MVKYQTKLTKIKATILYEIKLEIFKKYNTIKLEIFNKLFFFTLNVKWKMVYINHT